MIELKQNKRLKIFLGYTFIPVWLLAIIFFAQSRIGYHLLESIIVITNNHDAGSVFICLVLLVPIATATFVVTYAMSRASVASGYKATQILWNILISLSSAVVACMISFLVFVKIIFSA